jgi:transposase
MARITFQKDSVKELQQRLHAAYALGDVRLVRRIAVLLAIARGEGLSAVEAEWGISHQTSYNWLAAFVSRRWESLVYRKPAGRPARLTKHQKQQLYETVKAGPEAAGYACGCWTTCLIQEWIYQQFEVLYSRYYVAELLHHLGLSYQKACFVSDHLDEEARQQWMETVWPEIVAQARARGMPIYFGDEVSFAQWGSLGYTWAPKGQQPQVKTSGIRKGYKVFGVIEFVSGQFWYQGIEDRFNSDSYQVFLTYLLNKIPGPFILIQDGARYHTSKATRDFFLQHKERIIVYQLPSYSPDYNPIEFLWKKIKTKATHNRYFAEFAKLIQSVEDALALLVTQTEEIVRLMGLYTKLLADPAAVNTLV